MTDHYTQLREKLLRELMNLNVELTERLLVRGLRDNFLAFGFSKAVVGLSGGLDSSLAAYLATQALGAENVYPVLMPYKESNPESKDDALRVAKTLAIPDQNVITEDITSQIDACLKGHPELIIPEHRVRRGNKLARERMAVLYDYSMGLSALVVGTSNKTEIMVGYGTIYGDMASAVNPVGDLYKTQERTFIRALPHLAFLAEKIPTADLWPGQTDETELGMTYEDLDVALYALVDTLYKKEELIDFGFPVEHVERIVTMLRQSQYKRLPPIIIKVSARTPTVDFHYLRALNEQ